MHKILLLLLIIGLIFSLYWFYTKFDEEEQFMNQHENNDKQITDTPDLSVHSTDNLSSFDPNDLKDDVEMDSDDYKEIKNDDYKDDNMSLSSTYNATESKETSNYDDEISNDSMKTNDK